MKKTLTVMTLLAGAVSVYSQGAVSMNDYNFLQNGFEIQVFTAQSLLNSTVPVVDGQYAGFEEQGQPANSYLANPGTTVYHTGAPLGPGYDVGLLALDGGGALLYSQLTSQVTLSTINLWNNSLGSTSTTGGGNYGIWNSSAVATIAGSATTASVAVAAWQNSGAAGAATTLAEAQADGYAWGLSDIATANLATGVNQPGFLPTTITSFSLATTVPEPSTIALGVIGASALLFRRRK
jgi:hypothetical protein